MGNVHDYYDLLPTLFSRVLIPSRWHLWFGEWRHTNTIGLIPSKALETTKAVKYAQYSICILYHLWTIFKSSVSWSPSHMNGAKPQKAFYLLRQFMSRSQNFTLDSGSVSLEALQAIKMLVIHEHLWRGSDLLVLAISAFVSAVWGHRKFPGRSGFELSTQEKPSKAVKGHHLSVSCNLTW